MKRSVTILFILVIATLPFYIFSSLEERIYVDTVPRTIECILGADIGGTNSDFGIFTMQDNKLTLLISLHTQSQEIANFTTTVNEVLQHIYNNYGITIKRACFGAPGPASENRDYSKSSCMSCPVDAKDIIKKTALNSVLVVNDFELFGYGLDLINANHIVELNKGTPRNHAPKMILGAGTGLGTCLMVWDQYNQKYMSIALEGSCLDFAPQDEFELVLARYMKTIKGKHDARIISWKNILSGLPVRGIVKLYEFLGETRNYNRSSLHVTDAATIFQHYTDNQQCKDTINLFMQFYARFTRNVALFTLPYGGIYIVGGIAAKNANLFTKETFLDLFFNCHEMDTRLKQFPLYLVTDYNVSLYGAAAYLLFDEQKSNY